LQSIDGPALRTSVARWHHRRERGLTLLEVMITIAILTIGVVGVMGGVAAAQRISGINQSQAQLEPAMRQLSDFVRDSSTQGLGYKLCANLTNNKYSLAGLGAAPAGLQWSITDVAVSATNGGTRAGVPDFANSDLRQRWGLGCPGNHTSGQERESLTYADYLEGLESPGMKAIVTPHLTERPPSGARFHAH